MKKQYLAWVGQNATFGNPNPTTGFYSYFGDLYSFTNKQDRDNFCEEFSGMHNCYPRSISKAEARNKHLGMPVREYEADILNYQAVENGTDFLAAQ
jgi:hypothetical protein